MRRDRIEFEHFIMAGNHHAGGDLFPKLCGFPGCEVSRNAAGRVTPVDGQDGNVYFPVFEPVNQTLIRDAIAAVINRPFSNLNNQAYKTVITVFVLFLGYIPGR